LHLIGLFGFNYGLDCNFFIFLTFRCYLEFRSGELVEGEESSDEESSVSIKKTQKRFNQDDGDVDIGKVVCVEVTDKKKGKDNWFPGVIVSPVSQVTVKIKTKDEYLVRSFRDGR